MVPIPVGYEHTNITWNGTSTDTYKTHQRHFLCPFSRRLTATTKSAFPPDYASEHHQLFLRAAVNRESWMRTSRCFQ